MKHTHIAFVGGQTMPVYQGIMEMQPDGIVLVHSESTKKQADQIAHEKQDMTTLRCLPPVDMRQIKEAVGRMLDEFAQDKVTINVSSGTKPWALAFTMLTQDRANCQLIYIDQNVLRLHPGQGLAAADSFGYGAADALQRWPNPEEPHPADRLHRGGCQNAWSDKKPPP